MERPTTTRILRVTASLTLALLALTVWVRGEHVRDDRGSDSSEKSFMIILGISLGTAVTVAAVAFVATKTSLFK